MLLLPPAERHVRFVSGDSAPPQRWSASTMSGALFTGLAKHLQRFGLTSFTWSLGYVLIMWLMLWFLHRNRLFWRVQTANFLNPMNASTL